MLQETVTEEEFLSVWVATPGDTYGIGWTPDGQDHDRVRAQRTFRWLQAHACHAWLTDNVARSPCALHLRFPSWPMSVKLTRGVTTD